jgi:hypothetical protein
MMFAEVWTQRIYFCKGKDLQWNKVCKFNYGLLCICKFPFISYLGLITSVSDFITLRVNPPMSILEMLFYRKYHQSSSSFQTSKCLVRSLIQSPRHVLLFLLISSKITVFLQLSHVFISFSIGLSVPPVLEDSIIYCSWGRETWLCGIKYFHWFLEEVSTIIILVGSESELIYLLICYDINFWEDYFQIT